MTSGKAGGSFIHINGVIPLHAKTNETDGKSVVAK